MHLVKRDLSPGGRILVLVLTCLAASMVVAYVGYSMVAMVLAIGGDDVCATRSQWGQGGEDVGVLHQSWSFLPVGFRCTWTTRDGVSHSQVIRPWPPQVPR